MNRTPLRPKGKRQATRRCGPRHTFGPAPTSWEPRLYEDDHRLKHWRHTLGPTWFYTSPRPPGCWVSWSPSSRGRTCESLPSHSNFLVWGRERRDTLDVNQELTKQKLFSMPPFFFWQRQLDEVDKYLFRFRGETLRPTVCTVCSRPAAWPVGRRCQDGASSSWWQLFQRQWRRNREAAGPESVQTHTHTRYIFKQTKSNGMESAFLTHRLQVLFLGQADVPADSIVHGEL